jgi:hypothetical protein
MKRPLAVAAFAGLFFLAPAVFADGVYCGDTLVQPGYTEAQVVAACGSPTRTGGHEAYVNRAALRGWRTVHVHVIDWFYDRGIGEATLPRVLFFEGSVLAEVHIQSTDLL